MAKRKKQQSNRAVSKSNWLQEKRPFLQFALLFGLFIIGFYAFSLAPIYKDHILPAYLTFNAHLAGAILNLFGQNVAVSGNEITAPKIALEIKRGCDASVPTVLYVAAILAFTAPWMKRLWGIGIGVFVLFILNMIRILTLYVVGILFPKLFHIMHVDVWQAIFVFVTLLIWIVWAEWATRLPSSISASSQTKPDDATLQASL